MGIILERKIIMRRNFLSTSIAFTTAVVAIMSIGLIQSCYANTVDCQCRIELKPGEGGNTHPTATEYEYQTVKTFTGYNAMTQCLVRMRDLNKQDTCEGQCINRKGKSRNKNGGTYNGEWHCNPVN